VKHFKKLTAGAANVSGYNLGILRNIQEFLGSDSFPWMLPLGRPTTAGFRCAINSVGASAVLTDDSDAVACNSVPKRRSEHDERSKTVVELSDSETSSFHAFLFGTQIAMPKLMDDGIQAMQEDAVSSHHKAQPALQTLTKKVSGKANTKRVCTSFAHDLFSRANPHVPCTSKHHQLPTASGCWAIQN